MALEELALELQALEQEFAVQAEHFQLPFYLLARDRLLRFLSRGIIA